MSGAGVPKKRRRWIWWVVLAVVAVAVAAIALPRLFGQQSTQTQSATVIVQRRTLSAVVSGSGNLAAADVTQVQPGISGTVEGLSVKLGDSVKAGQVLLRLVNADLDAAVARAQASYQQARQQVQQAKAGLIQAQNNLYFIEHPSVIGTAPPKPVDASAVKLAKQQVTVASMGVTSATKSLDSASVALSQARDNAGKRTVTAPVGGVVTALSAQNGQSLGSGVGSSSGSLTGGSSSGGSGAVEISNLATLRARVQINEVDLVNVKIGQRASVSFDALPDGDTSGTISAISPTGTNTQGVVTYDVDVTLETIDSRLKPKMSCTVEIVTQTKENALVVPTSAIKTDTTTKKKYVVVLTNSASQQVAVTTGIVVGTSTEVLTGLTEGQTVVTSPAAAVGGSGQRNNGPGGGFGAMIGGGR